MTHPLYNRANDLVNIIYKEGKEVYKAFGPGLLESFYQKCLVCALKQKGHTVVTEKVLSATYMNTTIQTNFRLDMLVDDLVIVELKAVTDFPETAVNLYRRQCLTYLTIMNLPLALLINFGEAYYHARRAILKGANGWTAEPSDIPTL